MLASVTTLCELCDYEPVFGTTVAATVTSPATIQKERFL